MMKSRVYTLGEAQWERGAAAEALEQRKEMILYDNCTNFQTNTPECYACVCPQHHSHNVIHDTSRLFTNNGQHMSELYKQNLL